MPKYNPTHEITRNFAYGDPIVQYKKGQRVYHLQRVYALNDSQTALLKRAKQR